MKSRVALVSPPVAGAVLMAVLPVLGCAASSASQVLPAVNYRLIETFTFDDQGVWDYIQFDQATQRLYVGREDHLMVVDAKTGKEVGVIPDTPGIHGAAVVPELNRGFTSNGKDASITIFDLRNLQVIQKVKLPAARNPDDIFYDPVSKHIFTANSSKNSSVLDPGTGLVIDTIEFGARPEEGVPDGHGRIYFTLYSGNSVAVVDSKTRKVLNTWPTNPCEKPTGLSIDFANQRLFIGCGNKISVVLDARNGKHIVELPIGDGNDGAAFDGAAKLAFFTSGDGPGSLDIVQEETSNKFSVAQHLDTHPAGFTMALDPKTGRIYIPVGDLTESPVATPQNPHPNPKLKPGTFKILVYGR